MLVPNKVTVCAVTEASSLIETTPVLVPNAVGAKTTLIVQDVFTASDTGQLFVPLKSPEITMLLMVTGISPWLETVMV